MSTAAASMSARHVVVDSPIGPLTLVRNDGDDSGLTGLYYPGHWSRPNRKAFGPQVDSIDDRDFDEAVAQLAEYFGGERQDFDLPLKPCGSDQAQRVWQLIGEIPYGQTTSYGELARRVGGGLSPRDVGGFVGDNPLSIFIPCHRVVGAGGKLTGYAGGLDRKRYLLQLEAAIPAFTQPLW